MCTILEVATLPGNLEKPGVWQFRQNNLENPGIRDNKKKPGKSWNFKQKNWKNLEFLTILTCSAVKFQFDKNIYHIIKIFLSSSNSFFIKTTFKKTLQYFFNVFILFNTVSYVEQL